MEEKTLKWDGVFSYSFKLLLAFFFFLNTQVFAFRVIDKPLVDGTKWEGIFDNGAKFLYQKREEHAAVLTFLDHSSHKPKILSYQPFLQVLRFEEPMGGIPKRHRAAFLESADNLYALTDTGLFISVLEDHSRFVGREWSARADLEIANVAYAVVSGAYHSSQKISDQHFGETYLIRLSDGKVSLVDRKYRFELDTIRVVSNSIVFKDGENFSLADFEKELTERPKRFPFQEYATGQNTPKTARLVKRAFPNGNQLVVDLNGHGVFFDERQESGHFLRKQITDQGVTSYPSDKNTKLTHETLEDQKIVTVDTQKGTWFVTQNGQFGFLPTDYARVDKRFYVVREFLSEGKRYFLISFKFLGDKGQTFIIREDGVHFCVDFKFHELGQDFLDHQVEDGILQIAGSPRRVDLREFEAEATFNSQEMAKLTISDKHAQPQEMDPITYVSEKWADLIEEARQKNTAFPVLDEQTREELLLVLRKSERGSGVVLAGPGEGKTEDVMSLAADWAAGKIKGMPRTWRLLNFDPVSTEEDTQFVGTLASLMKALKETMKALPTFLFVDEMHALRGTGTHAGNKNDIFNLALKPGLANGTIRIIGTDTPDEYDEAYGNDGALLRRIARIRKQPLTPEKVLKGMQGWIKRYKKLLPEDMETYQASLQETLRLADEFMSEGSLLSRATDLLDETYARYGSLSVENVRKAAIKRHGADLDYFDLGKMEERIDNTRKLMDQFIVGQEEAKNIVIELARQKWARANDRKLPGIRLLLVGPPGQGKTEFIKIYAMGMRPHKRPEDASKRIMMRDYSSPYADPRALASEIASIIRQDPFVILSLDEFESANTSCMKVVLDMFDSGMIKDYHLDRNGVSRGVTEVHVKNAEFFLAGNPSSGYLLDLINQKTMGFGTASYGSDDMPNKTVSDSEGLLRAVQEDGVPKSVTDRVQSVIAFLPSTKEQFAEVLRTHLHQALKEFNTPEQSFTMPKDVEDKFIQAALAHFKFGHSNRKALSILQNSIRKAVAAARFAQKSIAGQGNFVISYAGNSGNGPAGCEIALEAKKEVP